MKPKIVAVLMAALGGALVVAGVALIYLPAAFVAAGGGLLAAGLLVDFEPRKPKGQR